MLVNGIMCLEAWNEDYYTSICLNSDTSRFFIFVIESGDVIILAKMTKTNKLSLKIITHYSHYSN